MQNAMAKYSYHPEKSIWKLNRLMEANTACVLVVPVNCTVRLVGTVLKALGNLNPLCARVIMPTAKNPHSTRTEAVFLGSFYHLLEGQLTLYL